MIQMSWRRYEWMMSKLLPLLPLLPLLALVLAAGGAACSTSAPQTNARDGGISTPEGGAPDSTVTGPKDCTKTALQTDGWTQIIGPDYVELSREDAIVELNWAIKLDDTLRAGDGVLENLWTRILGKRFTSGPRSIANRDMVGGPATEIASGTTGFIGLADVTFNGTSRPVVGITKDEATFRALFKDGAGLAAMHRYNDFPLACETLEGAWSTSFTVAGSSASTVTGLTVSSFRLDLTFAQPSYHRDQDVSIDTRREKVVEDGTFTASDHELVLTSSEGTATTYDAAYVAVQGGLALSLVNRQFTGEHDILLRP